MEEILEFISIYYRYFLNGVGITVALAFFTVIFAVIFGTFVALMRLSSNKFLKSISSAFIEIVRGTPLLVQVYILYYGLPTIGFELPQVDAFGISLTDFASVILALTINSTAYVAEIIRGGIQAVDKGQMEAARSLGLNYKMSMRYIIIPQSIKAILPALGNEFITVIKESAIVSVVGIQELMFKARSASGTTYKIFTPYIMAAVMYFVLTFGLSKLLGVAERRMKVSD